MKKAATKYLSVPVVSALILTVLPLLTTSFLSVHFIKNENWYQSFSAPQWISFALLGILSQALALTPPIFCALVLGYFWGWKTLPLLLFINLASIFLLNRIVWLLDHNHFIEFIEENPKAKKLIESIRTDELKIITLTKLSPVLPFALTNLIFTLSGAQLRHILLGGFLGMIPRTVLSVWTGTQAREIKTLLENPDNNSEQLMLIGLVLISAIGLFWVIGRALKRQS